jgi:predicted permease
MQAVLVQGARQPIVILSAAVVVVLIIACVNIATLLIARGSSRAREIATRMALGSGRTAVVRQLMVESVLLAALGGTLGLLVSLLSLQGLKLLGGSIFGELPDVGLDLRMLAVTGGLSLLTSLLFGLVPAMQASRINLQTALVDTGARGIAGGRHRLRRVLVVAEVALGVMLLVSAGLLVRQFINLRSLEPGFTADHLFTASVSIQDARYATAADVNRLFDGTIERLRQTPGITAASVSQGLPYQRLLNLGFLLEGDSPEEGRITNVSYVTTGFFSTFGIPITAGRAMDNHDTATTTPVVVVNQLFARIYLKDRAPIGFRLRLGGRPVEVVGIAGDVQQFGSGFSLEGMANGPIHSSPTIYVPAAQTNMGMFGWFSPLWTVRASSAAAATQAIRSAISAVDPLMPVSEVRSMAEVSAGATSRQQMMMWLVALMAAAAALLAAIGLHGLIAQSVAERTRELGIRLALGARPGATLGGIALSGAALSALGAVIGGALSFPATSLIASFLVDVPRLDAWTYLAVSMLVLVVTAVASVTPAMRILRLDPARTLRE